MGMWNIPVSLFPPPQTVDINCTLDEEVGDLFTWLGAPALPNAYVITIDNCILANIIITLDFPAETTFQFNVVNGGAIMGVGGNGAIGSRPLFVNGSNGSVGGHAMQVNSFEVKMDIDDGFLLGGGGGGGGGSGFVNGGGGGAGAGFNPTSGGIGIAPATYGGNGGQSGPGAGGIGQSVGINDGGDGGTFGAAGLTAGSASALTTTFRPGVGGRGGNAFLPLSTNGAVLTLNGVKTEAVLRSEDRLMGETHFLHFLQAYNLRSLTEANPGTAPLTFQNDGILLNGWSTSFDWQVEGAFLNGQPHAALNGDDYSVRAISGSDKKMNSWDVTPVADDTYIDLTADRSWDLTISSSGVRQAIQLFEIKRTTRADTEIIASGFYGINNTAP